MESSNGYSLRQINLSWIFIFVVSFLFFIYVVFSSFLSKHIDQSSFKDLRYAEYLLQENLSLQKETFKTEVARHVTSESFIESLLSKDSQTVNKLIKNWMSLGKLNELSFYNSQGQQLNLSDFSVANGEGRLSAVVMTDLIKGYEIFTYKAYNENLVMEILRRVSGSDGNLLGYVLERKNISVKSFEALMPEDIVLMLSSKRKPVFISKEKVASGFDQIKNLNSKAFEVEIRKEAYDGVSIFLNEDIKVYFLKKKLKNQLMRVFYRDYLVFFILYIFFISIVFYMSNFRLVQKPLIELGRFVEGKANDSELLDASVFEIQKIKHLVENKINQYNSSISENTLTREKEVNMMVASVAHELNNALSYFGGNLSYVKEEISLESPDTEEIKDALSDIEKGFERMKNIVSDLKVFSSKSDYNIKPVSINSINAQIKKEHPHIEINSETDDKSMLLIDEDRAMQVIKNLIQNATQSYEAKSINQNIKITVYKDPEESFIFFDVSDNGSGIPPEIKNKIFQPFFTTKKNTGGTGLGLSLSRSLIRGMEGDLFLKDTSPKGTIMCLKLRMAET